MTSILQHREYQMSVGLILNLLNELNKSIQCEHIYTIHFHKFSNEHEFNILFITYPNRKLTCEKGSCYTKTPTI